MRSLVAFPAMIAVALSFVFLGANVLQAWRTMQAMKAPPSPITRDLTNRSAPSSYWYGTTG